MAMVDINLYEYINPDFRLKLRINALKSEVKSIMNILTQTSGFNYELKAELCANKIYI
jgi:hypothetical protein